MTNFIIPFQRLHCLLSLPQLEIIITQLASALAAMRHCRFHVKRRLADLKSPGPGFHGLCRIQLQSRFPLHHFLVLSTRAARICGFYSVSSCRLNAKWFMLRTAERFRLEVQHFVRKYTHSGVVKRIYRLYNEYNEYIRIMNNEIWIMNNEIWILNIRI